MVDEKSGRTTAGKGAARGPEGGTGRPGKTPASRRSGSRPSVLPLLAAFLLGALTAWAALRWLPPPGDRGPGGPEEEIEVEDLPARLELSPATFGELPGWASDRTARALPALLRSCEAFEAQPDERSLGGAREGLVAGTVGDWRPFCQGLEELAADTGMAGRDAWSRADHDAVRALLERHLRPHAVTDRGDPEGFFTGYYEPTLQGSRQRSERFSVPLYLRPPELVAVDLGAFRPDLAGRRIAGRVEGERLVPFLDREAIDRGGLEGRGLELLWVDDPVDAFFLQVQGSGRVELAGGGSVRVGYAGQNGHPYVAIGRDLVERGAMELEEVSMQSIRAWLAAHPEEAPGVLRSNPSYVFFRRLEEEGPVGSQGVVLSPGRSLAVDRSFLPLGVPLWLDGAAPAPGRPGEELPLRRLMVAQDTGGAIRGPVRGDVFWGPGEEAEDVAGRMRHPGRLWLLSPRAAGGTAAAPAQRGPAGSAGRER